MRTIRLFGKLGKLFGKIHELDVKSPAEAIRALCANFPTFEKYLIESSDHGITYAVFNGKQNISKDELTVSTSGDIRIVPVIQGSKRGGVLQTIVGIILVVVGYYFGQTWLINIGVSLIIGGVVQMLTPIPKTGSPNERDENKPNNSFSGPVNTTAQGHPVPVGYGRLIVGSAVISAGIDVTDMSVAYSGPGSGVGGDGSGGDRPIVLPN